MITLTSSNESEHLSRSSDSVRSKINDLKNRLNTSESFPIPSTPTCKEKIDNPSIPTFDYSALPKLEDPSENNDQLPLPFPKPSPSTPKNTPSIHKISELKKRSYATAQLFLSGDESQIKKSERMNGCADHIIDVNGRAITSYCRVGKWCAVCANKDRDIKIATLRKALSHESFEQPHSWIQLRLSIPNCYPHEIKEQTAHLHKSFSRLMSYQAFKRVTLGFIRSTEITENPDTDDSANIHIHALLAVSSAHQRDSWITLKTMEKLWRRASKSPKARPHISRLKHDKKAGESVMDAVFKFSAYITKGIDPVNSERPLSDSFKLELSKQWSRVRLVSYGGIIRDALKAQRERFNEMKERQKLEKIETEKTEHERVELHATDHQDFIRKSYSPHSSISTRYPNHQHYKWDGESWIYRPLKSPYRLHHRPRIEHQMEHETERRAHQTKRKNTYNPTHPNLFINSDII